jgi:hypothetical protein
MRAACRQISRAALRACCKPLPKPKPTPACNLRPFHPSSYTTFGIATLMAIFIANGPDNSLQAWARPYAAKELEEEDAIFAAYAEVREGDRKGDRRLGSAEGSRLWCAVVRCRREDGWLSSGGVQQAIACCQLFSPAPPLTTPPPTCQDAALRDAKSAALRAFGKHPDRYYDGVMMRNEFNVLRNKAASE